MLTSSREMLTNSREMSCGLCRDKYDIIHTFTCDCGSRKRCVDCALPNNDCYYCDTKPLITKVRYRELTVIIDVDLYIIGNLITVNYTFDTKDSNILHSCVTNYYTFFNNCRENIVGVYHYFLQNIILIQQTVRKFLGRKKFHNLLKPILPEVLINKIEL